MLAAHRELAVPPEAGFMCWLADKYTHFTALDWQRISTMRSFAEEVSQSRKFETWNLTLEDVLDSLVNSRPEGYAEACDSVYWGFTRKFKPLASRWGDKNNFHCTKVSLLRSLFPDAQFLQIIRDPRDVACSYREVMSLQTESPYRPRLPVECGRIAEEWVYNVSSIESAAKDLPCEQYLVVKYEDLVDSPTRTLHEVCAWLEVDFEAQILSFNEQNKLLALEPVSTLDWKLRTLEPTTSSRAGRHAHDLSSNQRDAIEATAGEMMRNFGYKL